MNKRIEELAFEAARETSSNFDCDRVWMEKFAELLIKEAGEAAAFGDPSYSAQRNIYQHFGML